MLGTKGPGIAPTAGLSLVRYPQRPAAGGQRTPTWRQMALHLGMGRLHCSKEPRLPLEVRDVLRGGRVWSLDTTNRSMGLKPTSGPDVQDLLHREDHPETEPVRVKGRGWIELVEETIQVGAVPVSSPWRYTRPRPAITDTTSGGFRATAGI